MEIREPKIIKIEEKKGKEISIFIIEGSLNRIYGELNSMPLPGDFIIKQDSGKTALYKVTDIFPRSRIEDNYFGKVKFLGYVEDIQDALIKFGEMLQTLFTPVFESLAKLVIDSDFQRALLEYHIRKEENGGGGNG